MKPHAVAATLSATPGFPRDIRKPRISFQQPPSATPAPARAIPSPIVRAHCQSFRLDSAGLKLRGSRESAPGSELILESKKFSKSPPNTFVIEHIDKGEINFPKRCF